MNCTLSPCQPLILTHWEATKTQPNNSNIEKLRDILSKIISEKYSKRNLKDLPKTAAFFSEKNEVVNDNYKLKDKEFISIIPPIGGG